ncbi:hypothetical protein JTB14_000447 [Gonioctena quinquepunctata]|nr:hypothetical protein JTB14_000447 [Gonioctena quinquepunctata]
MLKMQIIRVPREYCTREDRSEDCLRCGGKGHQIRECPTDNKEFYYNYKTNEHRYNSTRCPFFRKFLEDERAERRPANHSQ